MIKSRKHMKREQIGVIMDGLKAKMPIIQHSLKVGKNYRIIVKLKQFVESQELMEDIL